MRRYYVETARSVINFPGDDPDECFANAEAYVPPERMFHTSLKEDLAHRGLMPWRSRQFKLVEHDGFIEFDSGNISHAGAIYGAWFEGPDGLVAILSKEVK